MEAEEVPAAEVEVATVAVAHHTAVAAEAAMVAAAVDTGLREVEGTAEDTVREAQDIVHTRFCKVDFGHRMGMR